MIKKFLLLVVFLSIFSITGCSSDKNKRDGKIKIVASNWIGFTPLLYAYEKGKLEALNVEVIVTNSLQSSLIMYEKNNYDGICSTQKELTYLNQNNKDHLPVIVFDRSYGGDVILSNIPKEELYKNKCKKVDVFLEKNSVNEILFEVFKKLKNWSADFSIIDINQYNISRFEFESNTKVPKLIITYEPHASKLKQKGFYLIESTKNDKFLVFDFLSVKKGSLKKDEIYELQKIVNDSILKLKQDPKSFYETVKIYFGDTSYDEFISSLDQIQFFDRDRKGYMIDLIQKEKVLKKIEYIKEQ